MRTKIQWLEEFDQTMPKCKWFIDRYLNDAIYDQLMLYRKENNTLEIYKILDHIWFELPDSFCITNQVAMDNGWREFLHLIEFESKEEQDLIFKS